MPLLANKKTCTGCMCCADTCKHQAIKIIEDINGLWYPKVDKNKCLECHSCEIKCNLVCSGKLLNTNNTENFIPYTAWNKNSSQRSISTSGGSFAAIASYILEQKGIVCGATIEKNRIKHIFISDSKDLPLIQGVKYIQSNTNGIYKQTKTYLNEGKLILFSGTPCQIAALYSYLGKRSYNNLYTAEVICHGVISNIILDYHLKYNHANQIISFRSKELGWGKDTFTTVMKDGKETILKNRRLNFFYDAFKSDTVNRPSCYSCKYANIKRIADITMGDYWGNKQFPSEETKGLSLIIANNLKGNELIQQIEQLSLIKTTWKECLPKNPRLYCDKHECEEISITQQLHKLFLYTPRFFAKNYIGPRATKRNILAYIRNYYIIKKKKKIDKRVKQELEQTIKLFESYEKNRNIDLSQIN